MRNKRKLADMNMLGEDSKRNPHNGNKIMKEWNPRKKSRTTKPLKDSFYINPLNHEQTK
tara:strand:+ start:1348 stop:1524 length:177 start_codon:yes stop_codon:yes gene_type:complete